MLDRNKIIFQENKSKRARNAGPPLFLTLGSQSQRFSEFEANLVYRATFRTARSTPSNLVFKINKNKNSRPPNHLNIKY